MSAATVSFKELDGDQKARAALEFYDRVLKPRLEPDHLGEEVAVHMESGDWEVAPSSIEAGDRLHLRHPGAWFVYMTVGQPATPEPGVY